MAVTLLEGFESISGSLAAYTGSSYTWTGFAAGGSGLGITLSTSNVTQGTSDWRMQGTSINDFEQWGYANSPDFATGIDLSAYSTVLIDCYGATVPANLNFFLIVYDLGDFSNIADQTADGFSGADTLSVDLSLITSKTNCAIAFGVQSTGGATSSLNVYLDNLRADDGGGGGGTPISVFYNHLKTQGIA